jgi:peroxiredoxin
MVPTTWQFLTKFENQSNFLKWKQVATFYHHYTQAFKLLPMKWLLIIIIFSSALSSALSQPVSFTIEGNVKNVDSGTIFLVPVVSNEKYYGENFPIDSAFIKDGIFKFSRKASDKHTYAYRLVIKSPLQYGATDFIFINGKNVTVEIDSLDEHVSPKIATSLVQNEIKYEYNPFFEPFLKKLNEFYAYEETIYDKFGNDLPKEYVLELEKMQKEFFINSDSLFLLYASTHPKSQVTFWKMIERLKNLGYNSNYKRIFEALPEEIKNSGVGKSLLADILESELLGIGSVFPAIRLENTEGEFMLFDKTLLGKSYTLLDFWFTDCSPCRKQFPEFKRLLNAYKSDGFQIIGISIDGQPKINAWKNLIKKDNLNWYHLLDKGGVVTQKLGIHSFPTNFLLDSNGVILQKNITLSALGSLLMENNPKINIGER